MGDSFSHWSATVCQPHAGSAAGEAGVVPARLLVPRASSNFKKEKIDKSASFVESAQLSVLGLFCGLLGIPPC